MQHIKGQGDEVDAAIDQGLLQQLPLGSHQHRRRAQDQKAQGRQHHAAGRRGVHDQGKDVVGPLAVPLAHGLGDQGAAASAEHEAHASQDQQHRDDEIHRRKGGLACVIGHEEAVHHAVNGGEDYHGDGRQGKADQLAAGEMIRKLDGCFAHDFSLISRAFWARAS